MCKNVYSDILPHFCVTPCLREPHCLTRNLTLRSSRNTTSANHLAFSTKPPLHGLPFAKKTVSTENAFQEVDSS